MSDELQIGLLGELELRRGGKRLPLPLPQSKKTRALLAYLILKGAPQRRDALCDVLWELPDDPRAALRWSLSKLRPLVNEEARERLSTDRERAGFSPNGASVDIHVVQRACNAGLERLSVPELRALLGLFRGPLLSGLELPAQPTFESWRLGQQEAARHLNLLVLDELTHRLDDCPDSLVDLLRARIDLEPGDEETHNRLLCTLRAGNAADAAQQLELSRRVLSALGPFDEARLARSASESENTRQKPRAVAPIELPVHLRQDIRFCTAEDGVRIAYATVGSGPPLMKTANWMNHLEFDWESPVFRHFFRAIAAEHTLVRYDSRGNGLSDWDAKFSVEDFVLDLKAVADAAGLDRFPLIAISQGCAVAVEFAVRWPERVSKLLLYGGYARGWRARGDPEMISQSEAMIHLTRTGWGKDNPAYRQMFTTFFIPDASQEQMDWFNELQRITTSPNNAADLLTAFGDIDVTKNLARVTAPTLVMHARDDARIPHWAGREMAAGIPNARFVTLESQNHIILEHEPAWPRFLEEIRAFLAE